MGRLMDDWCLRFPGVKDVRHVYFHAVHDGDMEARGSNLAEAYARQRILVTSNIRDERLRSPWQVLLSYVSLH